MANRKMTLIFLLLFCSIHYVGTTVAQPIKWWVGKYLYQGSAGTTYGGSYVGEEIWLIINKEGSCDITEQGYMLDKKIRCRTILRKESIDILFLSQVNKNDESQGGYKLISLYRQGDILFSLEKVDSEDDVITHWKKMQVYGVKEQSGYYFKPVF